MVEKKNILILGLFPPPYSSGERMANKLVYDICKEEFNTYIVNFSLLTLRPNHSSHKKIIYYINFFIRYIRQLFVAKSMINQNEFDCIYFVVSSSWTGHFRDIFMMFFLKKAGQSWIAQVHNGNFSNIFKRKWHKKFTKAFFSDITYIIVLSEKLKADLEPYIDKRKIFVIPNTIDFELYQSEMIVRNNNQPFRLLYLSNMNPTKGYKELAEATHQLVLKGRMMQVDLVGDWLSEDQRSSFNEYLKKNELEQTIIIHGSIGDRKKIVEFYKNADAFILPTYFPQEMQPLSIIEALNFGLPVISTYHASIPEFIIDGYNGLMVEKKSSDSIYKAVERLIDDPDLRKRLSFNARETFIQKFSPQKYKENLIKVING